MYRATVRDDNDEQFFDYGFDGESKTTRLYCQTKHKIPNSFKSTCFGFVKNQFEFGAFAEKEPSDIFFLLALYRRSVRNNKYVYERCSPKTYFCKYKRAWERF